VGQFVKGLGAQIRPSLARALGLTLLASLINYGQGWLLARAIGVPLSLGDSAGLLALVSLLGLLPVSISGVGVREAFLSLAFPALGFTAQQGLTFGLLVFGTLYLTLVVSGFAAFQLAPPLASEGEPGTPHG
jgi:uncharacterized membrane protein YbhN (UPF0104 family)